MTAIVQNFIRSIPICAAFAVAFGFAPTRAHAVDLSTIMFAAAPSVVHAVERPSGAEVEHSPKRQPWELKRIYRRYRTVFRTVAKGVDLSQELLGVETPGDTLRVRFRPTSANPERMGGVVSCNIRF